MIAQIGVFVAVTAAALILLRFGLVRWSPDRARFRQRLQEEFATDANDPSPLYKNLDALSAIDPNSSAERPAGEPAPVARRSGWRAWGEERLRRAGLRITPEQFLYAVAGCSVAAGVCGAVFVSPLGGAAGAVAGAVVPFVVLNVRRARRHEKYIHQIAGAFELMARVLKAGQSVPEAFRAAVGAFEDPLSDEFGRCLHQIEHGLRPDAAFRDMSERAGILELRIFVVAMTIQRQTGGNLSEVLERLAGVVRARIRVRQKIRALTAEGRMQSLTLTVLPGLVFAMMYVLNRTYAEALLAQWRLVLGTIACMTVGTLWIRSIMNFEG